MRVGELTSLDVVDFDLDNGEVTLKLKKKRSNTNVTAGVYKATIVASAYGASKTFDDVLQIEVSKAA